MDERNISGIFKTEYSNLVAVLCHYYGVTNLQLAEDIVSETFLTAMKSWSHNGIPTSPTAWLRKTAKNKLTDHFRRKKVYEEKVIPEFHTSSNNSDQLEITDEIIADSQLKMLFVVCDPDLHPTSQICLALRILCGFNIDEIATALLSNKSSINKKLYRAKQVIKEKNSLQTNLSKDQYISRLDNVLRVIYLLFNEGYYSSINEKNLRHEICWEAMRLCIFLTNQNSFPKVKTQALLALMCFHSSRFSARLEGENGDLLYYDQDKSKWDVELIKKGQKYLNLASKGSIVSKYHLEAAIAFWHTNETDKKWEKILTLYNKLLTLEYSPTIALNRTYALAKANSVDEAIKEANKLGLSDNHYFYALLAEFYKMKSDREKELYYLNKALNFVKKENEKELILSKIEKVKMK